MKTPSRIVGLLLICCINAALGGPDVIIRERAKELNNQNNVRQGVVSPAPTTRATPSITPPTAAASANAAQPAGVGRLPADLAAIKPNTPVPLLQNQLLTQDIMAMVGPNKVSSATAAKLARSISDALSSKPLSTNDRARLVQDLNGALCEAKITPLQAQKVLDDIQAIFQASGQPRNTAVGIVADLKAVTAEAQKSSK